MKVGIGGKCLNEKTEMESGGRCAEGGGDGGMESGGNRKDENKGRIKQR